MNLKKLNIKYFIPIILITVIILFFNCVSFPLFKTDYSTVLYDKNKKLIGAHIANDGQWRFPLSHNLPDKFKKCIIMFEDEQFYRHPGINISSILRALYQNLSQQRIVSGGSTITMQLARMSTGHKRTIINKLIEIFQALRIELKYTKEEILEIYSAHAPFGGNTVGLESAAQRYFGRPPSNLSWAESATLAVLPNAPGIIHTKRNRKSLRKKRDGLLLKLLEKNVIDSLTYSLALEEELPEHPLPFPQLSKHLLTKFRKIKEGKQYISSLDAELQRRVVDVVQHNYKNLKLHNINNAAAIVVDVKSGKTLAYCGNTTPTVNEQHENSVDIITSSRSSGSILKPFLYCACMQEGIILPNSFVIDIPTYYHNFNPKNYDKMYSGVVPAMEALSRSLNVPAVRLLNKYNIAKCCNLFNKIGLSTINKNEDYYGLSLILGGAEVNLFEIAGAYASMARTLIHFNENNAKYYTNEYQKPLLMHNDSINLGELTNYWNVFSAGAIYHTFEGLTSVIRPEEENGWQAFSSSRKIAWKTGTSFGFRDAWAVGVTPEYVVGVWVGNATGKGCPGIIGGVAAAPIMFDIYKSLPNTSWFETPYDDLVSIPICTKTGFKAGEYCPLKNMNIPKQGVSSPICKYHQLIHLDKDKLFRVNSSCYPATKIIHKNWFSLPPIQELYYKKNNSMYRPLPPMKDGCSDNDKTIMEFVYPQSNTKIFIPTGIDGELQAVVIKIAHKNPKSTLYWHLDDTYLGQTKSKHEYPIVTSIGKHTITVVDNNGNTIKKNINCVGVGRNYE